KGAAIKWARTSLLIGVANKKRRMVLDAKSSRPPPDLYRSPEGEGVEYHTFSLIFVRPSGCCTSSGSPFCRSSWPRSSSYCLKHQQEKRFRRSEAHNCSIANSHDNRSSRRWLHPQP